jgi:hypothetical protein
MARIDWASVRAGIEKVIWQAASLPDPDAGPYETRRIRLLEESEMPGDEDALVNLVDEARHHGYGTAIPPGDGLWITEVRYPDRGR